MMNAAAANRFPDDDAPRSLLCFLRARMTRLAVAAAVFYITLASWLPAGWLAEVMRCFQFTLSFMVLMGYWRRASVCFFVRGRWPETHNVVALGIWISWTAICLNSAWAVLYRLSGQPSWMINNDYYTAWTAASSFAACLHVFAPNLMGPDMPRMDKARFVFSGTMGLTLLAVVVLWRPDLSPIADWLYNNVSEPDILRRGLWQYFTTATDSLSGWLP